MIVFGLLLACLAAGAGERPNFILCMADDQGWGDVGYQHPTHLPKTPVLDEMARTGLRFDHFYAAAPVCSPTRGSVLTGRHPNRFGCFSWGYTLRPQELTIAEVLQHAGYRTGHFGKWHLGSVVADSPVAPGQSGFGEWFSAPNFYENSPLFSHRGKVVRTQGESSLVTVEPALEFMAQAVRDQQPFLAVIWFGNPHGPHEALPELRALYPDLPPKLQNYYGEISGIDRAMGRLRQGLRDLKVERQTVLWYTSDNGAAAPGSTGGLRGKKGTLYEGGLRVPTVVEWPGTLAAPPAAVQPAGTVDIYPTLLELAGVTADRQPPLDGISLATVIRGAEGPRTKPLGFWVYPAAGNPTPAAKLLAEMLAQQEAGEAPPVPAFDKKSHILPKFDATNSPPGPAAWLDGRWKLHRVPGPADRVDEELYDLASDPAEARNLATDPAYAERLAAMRTALAEWQQSVLASLRGADYPK